MRLHYIYTHLTERINYEKLQVSVLYVFVLYLSWPSALTVHKTQKILKRIWTTNQ